MATAFSGQAMPPPLSHPVQSLVTSSVDATADRCIFAPLIMPEVAPVSHSRPSRLYQLSLASVTVTMVILPCIYVALTALTCFGVYYFATHYFAAIWEWHLGGNKYGLLLKVICSVTPLL